MYRLHTPELWPTTLLPLSVGWILLAIMAGHLLTQHDGPRRFGSYMGARTLPIFVLQCPMLVLLDLALDRFGGILGGPDVQLPYPLAMTSALVAAALAIHTAARSTRWWLLFEAPEWLMSPGRVRVPAPRGAPAATRRAQQDLVLVS